ncbi:MAG: VWA domain-containing protein [Myxococcales bacterium]|nr:VWA domain-containing protein [Myxococcales bacterium]
MLRTIKFMVLLWGLLACDGDDSSEGDSMGGRQAGDASAAARQDFANAPVSADGGPDAATAADVAMATDTDTASGTDCGLAGCGRAVVSTGGRVDLLFVVDDSGSMSEEQAALALEFPRLMQKLTSGDHDQDGVAEYAPVEDLHLGVVSTNLGAGGSAVTSSCSEGGDSGRLLSRSSDSAACNGDYPTFLSYLADGGDPEQTAQDFACLAVLGTRGCGYEQPLESALKALWPSADPSIRFMGNSIDEQLGRGDRENAGFLRNDPNEPAATLAIVVVSDEDDCSAYDPWLWTAEHFLLPEDPRVMQPLNLRCFYNPDRLHPIERYLHGYRGLHGLTGARVLFAAIVGVPVDLVDQPALAAVDWGDEAQREAHYQLILDDPRMQEREDTDLPEGEPANLVPSCESEQGKAYPPRRIVELARRFGPNSLVQSICGDNLGPPIDLIVRNVVETPQ